MTADVELLPLPSGNVAHLIAAQAAEIEALRAEVEAWRAEVELWRNKAAVHQYRRKRLAEALRLIESAKDRGFGIDYARGVAQSALLRDQEEGK